MVGATVGRVVGTEVVGTGILVGSTEGDLDGALVGMTVGPPDGDLVGLTVGLCARREGGKRGPGVRLESDVGSRKVARSPDSHTSVCFTDQQTACRLPPLVIVWGPWSGPLSG
jgi:hypothetical protein